MLRFYDLNYFRPSHFSSGKGDKKRWLSYLSDHGVKVSQRFFPVGRSASKGLHKTRRFLILDEFLQLFFVLEHLIRNFPSILGPLLSLPCLDRHAVCSYVCLGYKLREEQVRLVLRKPGIHT